MKDTFKILTHTHIGKDLVFVVENDRDRPGGDSSLIGKTVQLNGGPYKITRCGGFTLPIWRKGDKIDLVVESAANEL